MKVNGVHHRTIRVAADGWAVEIIDQTRLPHRFELVRLESVEDARRAIVTMQVRGAPLIGVTAAYGVCLGLRVDPSDRGLERTIGCLLESRPTAVNLHWALDEMRRAVASVPRGQRVEAAYARAFELCEDDVECCRRIGEYGAALIRGTARSGQSRVNVLTHCNAGWLATVDWGTALAPVYLAHEQGVPVHVWVDETRPRNQGAALTAFELGAHGVPHTLVVDNAGGHLMQHGLVDLCLVGTDRTTARGDVANKIGTYLKALAARDNGIPFYVAAPSSSIDWSLHDGVAEIPIEERASDEVTRVCGRTADGVLTEVAIAPAGTPAANYAFDVTPARLVTALVTERGVCPATAEGLMELFPERVR